MNRDYKYWDKAFAKLEKKRREFKMIWFENLPSQRLLDRLYNKGKLTTEQYEELVKRLALYHAVSAFGYFRTMEVYKNDEFFNKYYSRTEKTYANGKTLSQMFEN